MAPPQNKENSTVNSKRQRLRLGAKKSAASCKARHDASLELHTLPSEQGPHAPTPEHSPADGRAAEQVPSDRATRLHDGSSDSLPAWSHLIDVRSSRDARPACSPPPGSHDCPPLCPHVPDLTTLSTTRIVPPDALIRGSELPVPLGLLELIEADEGLLALEVPHVAADHLSPGPPAAASLPQRRDALLGDSPAHAQSTAAMSLHVSQRASFPTAPAKVQGVSSKLQIAQACSTRQLDPTSPTLLEVAPAAGCPAPGHARSRQSDTAVPPDAHASPPSVQLQHPSHRRRRPTPLAARRPNVLPLSQPFSDAVSQRPPESTAPIVTPAFAQAVAQTGVPAHDVVRAHDAPRPDQRHALGEVGEASTERRPSQPSASSSSLQVQGLPRQLPDAAVLASAPAACAGVPCRTSHHATHAECLSESVAASAPYAPSAWQGAGERREALLPSRPVQQHLHGDGQRAIDRVLPHTSTQRIQPPLPPPPTQSYPSRSSLPAMPRHESTKQALQWQPSPAQQQQLVQPAYQSCALAQQPRQPAQHLHPEYSAQAPPLRLSSTLHEQQHQPPAEQYLGPRTSVRSHDNKAPLQPPHGHAARCCSFPVHSNHLVPSPNLPFPPQQRMQSTPQQQERQWQQDSPPTHQDGRQSSIMSHGPWQPPPHSTEQQPIHRASSTYHAPNAGMTSTEHIRPGTCSGQTWPPAPVPCIQGRQQQPDVHQWSPPVVQGARQGSQVAGPCANTPIRPAQVHQPSPLQNPHGNSAPSPRPPCPAAPHAQYTPLPQTRHAWPPIAAVNQPVLPAQPQPPVPVTPLPSSRSRCAMCDTFFAVQDPHGPDRLCPDCLACVF
jgi:hypothetical protein